MSASAPILIREPYRLGYVKLWSSIPRWWEVWFVDLETL